MNYQQCSVENGQQDRLYSNVYIPQPNTVDERSHIFFVDSRDVNKTNDFQYDIIMNTPFKNVHSIELKGISAVQAGLSEQQHPLLLKYRV